VDADSASLRGLRWGIRGKEFGEGLASISCCCAVIVEGNGRILS
jgi:hypothetical protein